MKFKSKKDPLVGSIILGSNALLLGIVIFRLLDGDVSSGEYVLLVFVLGLVGILFWIYYGTSYELTQARGLVYRCGPLKGRININSITEVIKGKTLWVGYRPATSRKGLIIKYNRYDEIYISPSTNDAFIKSFWNSMETSKSLKRQTTEK